MDAQTRQIVDLLARELATQRREIAALRRAQRTPQLAHSSLEEGQALEVRDDEGNVRRRWGWIDGAVGETTEGGDPVSAPTVPLVTPSIAGLRVAWDGLLAGDPAIPVDFDHMAVHVSTVSGFVPDSSTHEGTIRRAGEGGMLPVVPLPYVPHYVVLVPVTTGGVQGEASTEASGTPVQVDGPDLVAGSVTAGTIAAGAVTADKLEAVLALVTTIVAGIPGAARVELDQDGLRGYNELNELIFAIDSLGNAAFTGDITGSEITGSRMTIGAAPGNVGAIEETDTGTVRARVTGTGGARAQLSASSTQAEFTVWSDETDPSTPIGGVIAEAGQVVLTMQSKAGDWSQPYADHSVRAGSATGLWSSGSGSAVQIQALLDYASILLTAPPAADPDDAQSDGVLYTQRYANDFAAVSMQGPMWKTNTGPEYMRRSALFCEGSRPERPYTRVVQQARRVQIFGETVDGVIDTTSDGVFSVADTHSINAPAHRPHISELITPPVWTDPTTGPWIDFTAAEWAPISWRTGWSGWVEVTIHASGLNPSSDLSSFGVSCRLSGGSTIAGSLDRCAYIRSIGQGFGATRTGFITFPLELVGITDYVLTPQYRLSSYSSTPGQEATMDTALANRITVRNLP